MDAQKLAALRLEKDQFFAQHPHSPLTTQQKEHFNGLDYYPPNPELDLSVTVEPFEQADEIAMLTTNGAHQHYTRYGQFSFAVAGETVKLTIYAGEHGFFLPFVDANAGTETYPAGRYLEPEHLGGNQFHVDFNMAYSPFCAYNEPEALAAQVSRLPQTWTCPITPAENRLTVPVHAGEKSPSGDWADQG
jgi:hypothetical protein